MSGVRSPATVSVVAVFALVTMTVPYMLFHSPAFGKVEHAVAAADDRAAPQCAAGEPCARAHAVARAAGGGGAAVPAGRGAAEEPAAPAAVRPALGGVDARVAIPVARTTVALGCEARQSLYDARLHREYARCHCDLPGRAHRDRRAERGARRRLVQRHRPEPRSLRPRRNVNLVYVVVVSSSACRMSPHAAATAIAAAADRECKPRRFGTGVRGRRETTCGGPTTETPTTHGQGDALVERKLDRVPAAEVGHRLPCSAASGRLRRNESVVSCTPFRGRVAEAHSPRRALFSWRGKPLAFVARTRARAPG